jgi:hypothetical protein
MRAAGLGLVVGVLVAAGSPARADVQPGMTLDATTADQAADLLPPEILKHYKNGEYMNKVIDFPADRFKFDDSFNAGTERNRTNLVLAPDKQPVDKATGKRPEYLQGLPFPDIDEKDPDAGYKILWNLAYAYYAGGNSHNWTLLNWISPTGVGRAAGQDVHFLYYDGQPPKYAPKTNPDNLLFQLLAVTASPADLQGSMSGRLAIKHAALSAPPLTDAMRFGSRVRDCCSRCSAPPCQKQRMPPPAKLS